MPPRTADALSQVQAFLSLFAFKALQGTGEIKSVPLLGADMFVANSDGQGKHTGKYFEACAPFLENTMPESMPPPDVLPEKHRNMASLVQQLIC